MFDLEIVLRNKHCKRFFSRTTVRVTVYDVAVTCAGDVVQSLQFFESFWNRYGRNDDEDPLQIFFKIFPNLTVRPSRCSDVLFTTYSTVPAIAKRSSMEIPLTPSETHPALELKSAVKVLCQVKIGNSKCSRSISVSSACQIAEASRKPYHADYIVGYQSIKTLLPVFNIH